MGIDATPQAILPQRWAEVLDRVTQALAKAQAAAAERERNVTLVSLEDKAASQTASWQLCLERLRTRLGGLDACLEHVKEEAAALESSLSDTVTALQHWQAASRPLCEKLGKRQGIPVG